jgi:uncharacterized integral membrane protein (TIGR00697 family)
MRTPPPTYRYLDVITATFVTVLVVSNIASSAKIVDLGFSLFGVPMAFDGGTLLFPVSYIFGDILTEVYGLRAARRVIWTGFVTLAATSLVFFILKLLPGEAAWQSSTGQDAYDAILGGVSSGGIAVASLLAYLAGSLSNAFSLASIRKVTGERLLWVRTMGSTLIGELVDTLLFVLVASVLGVFPWEIFISLVLTNYLFKCGVEAVMTPFTYGAVGILKRREPAPHPAAPGAGTTSGT